MIASIGKNFAQMLSKGAPKMASAGSRLRKAGARTTKELGMAGPLGAAFAIPTASFLTQEVGYPLAEGVGESLTGYRNSAMIMEAFQSQMREQAMRARVERLRANMIRAEKLLEKTDPQLYNEVLAGRALPPDATVIGGTRRRDLMIELTSRIANNEFSGKQALGIFTENL